MKRLFGESIRGEEWRSSLHLAVERRVGARAAEAEVVTGPAVQVSSPRLPSRRSLPPRLQIRSELSLATMLSEP